MSKPQNNAVTNSANNLVNSSNAQMLPYISSLQGSQSQTATTNQQPSFNSAFGAFNDATTTGGFDPTQYSSTLGGYNNLASTGGFTPAQSNAYMDQATSGVTNTYNTLAAQLAQNKAKTGGLGGSGEQAQMARQLAQTQASAEQGAAVNLNQLKTSNMLSGLGGSSSLQASQAGNKLSAASGLSGLYNTATGQITAQGNQILQAMGLNFSNQAEALQALTKLATSPSSSQGILGNIAEIGGMAMGAISGIPGVEAGLKAL